MAISLIDPQGGDVLRATAEGLADAAGKVRFPLVDGAYRIVPGEGYSSNFGFQWNLFARTQIDKFTGFDISRERLQAETGWNFDAMAGESVLEVGSGAGRFTQILLDHTAAEIHSVDYSEAVAANFANNGPNDRLNLYQASVYEMPFAPRQFDKVICIGVLQHTPDVRKSIESLASMVKPGGQLVVDFYPIRGWWSKINAKYMLRPFTRHMNKDRLLKLIRANANWMIGLYKINRSVGLGVLNRFIPIADFAIYSLPENITADELRELCILDTFDMFSPEFDQPQRLETVRRYFVELGLADVFAEFVHFGTSRAAVVRGRRPSGPA